MHIQITFERIGMRSYRMIWSKRRYIVSFVNEERRACSTLLPPKMMRVMRRNFLGMKKSSPSDLKMTKRAGLSGAFFLFWKQSSRMCDRALPEASLLLRDRNVAVCPTDTLIRHHARAASQFANALISHNAFMKLVSRQPLRFGFEKHNHPHARENLIMQILQKIFFFFFYICDQTSFSSVWMKKSLLLHPQVTYSLLHTFLNKAFCVFLLYHVLKRRTQMILMSWFTENKEYISGIFFVAKAIKKMAKLEWKDFYVNCSVSFFFFPSSLLRLASASSGGPVDAQNEKMWFMKFDMQILIFTKQRKTCFCEFSCLEACQYNPQISYSGVFYTKHEFALVSNPFYFRLIMYLWQITISSYLLALINAKTGTEQCIYAAYINLC